MKRRPPVSAIILLGIVLAVVGCQSTPAFNGTYLDPPTEAKGFELTSADGSVDATAFEGRLVLLTFGYSHCPDVCPATMSRLARAMDLLGDQARDVQVVLIAVDPERDTPERIGRYAAGYDSSFVGLSGTPQQIAEVTSDYGIYYEQAEGESAAGYLMDHTAAVTVLDRQGRSRLVWSFGTTAEEMASDLRQLIDRS